MSKYDKVTSLILGTLATVMIYCMLLVSILTPEKTKYGMYTDPIEYWTNDVYFNENFN